MLGLTRVRIAGPSMAPALMPGDWWLVRTIGPVRPGSAVLLRHPHRDLLVVKRAVRREEGGWWVEGDDPELSEDSRTWGAVPASGILGVLVLRYRRGSVPRP